MSEIGLKDVSSMTNANYIIINNELLDNLSSIRVVILGVCKVLTYSPPLDVPISSLRS